MKKNSSKCLAILLMLVLVMSAFAGCGGDTEEPAEEGGEAATLVVMNAVVYTMDEAGTMATAVAVSGDEIVYVGDDAGAEAYIGEDTEVIDAGGMMVTPGFINGHDHIASAELEAKTTLSLFYLEPDLEVYTAAVQEYADANPDFEIISVGGMDLKAYGNAIPNNDWVNNVVTDKPIDVVDQSFHGSLLNDVAIEMCGITDETPTPDGGEIYRYPDGSITGYFSDCRGISSALPPIPELTDEQWLEAYEEYEAMCNSLGMTGSHDGGSSDGVMALLSAHGAAGEMSMRFNIPLRSIDGVEVDNSYSAEYANMLVEKLDEAQALENDFLQISGIKTIIDGVPEGKSALLIDPYAPEAEMAADYVGPKYCTQEEMSEFVSILDKAGYQVLIHAMGDGGCRVAVNAFTNALDTNGMRDARHTIIHATLMDPGDIIKAGEYGIYAGMQPVWFYVEPQFGALELQMFGEERFWREYVTRDMVDAGMTITGSADYSVTPDLAPLTGIECGVTQGSPYPGQQGDPSFVRNADQVLTVMEMLQVYTINAAKQTFMDDIAGTLEVGKKGDMVILAEDITKIDPLNIAETEIVYTIFGGEVVYSK